MTSMREALEKAYDNDVGQTEDPPSPVGDAPGGDSEGGASVAEPLEQESSKTPEPADTPSEQTDEPPEAAKAGLKFLPADEGEGKADKESAKPETPVERAPAGWRGEAKGHWGELPEPVRQEVLRRERETATALDQSTQARRFHQEFGQMMSPFMTFIEAERSTPMQAVQNVMQTAAGLRVGTPHQKAAIVADIIKSFGVDVGTLDNLLVGGQQGAAQPGQPQAPDAGIQQYLDQRLAPVNELVSQFQGARQSYEEKMNQQVDQEYTDFLESGEADYFEDVREDVADILDIAARRNQKMTIKEAYKRAIAMNPEISSAVAQKKAVAERQAQAAAQQASIEKKKRASASVQGSVPGTNGATPPTNMRDQLAAAWDAQEGGGGI